MRYTLSDIAAIIEAEAYITNDLPAEHLLLDSRKVFSAGTSLFFAIKGFRRDGHQFIPELYKKGVRSFIVSDKQPAEQYPEANFLLVDDTQVALQMLAAHHREQFDIPVIGITGSNGKTIVKEWLFQLLHEDFNIVRSPKSYNSQIGVPLSIWQMNEHHTLAIFEAGISEQGEMRRLERMIQPTIGVLTNIGAAHSEGFVDDDHKFREKLTLFRNSKVLIGKETDMVHREGVKEILEMLNDELRLAAWGTDEKEAAFVVKLVEKKETHTTIQIGQQTVEIPFTDDASVENAITCYAVMQQLGIAPETIVARMTRLQPVNMRLEMKKGLNHCTIINDSYSADLSSLEIALNFLSQQSGHNRRTVILSDFLQSSLPDADLYRLVSDSLQHHQVSRLIAIGDRIGTAAGYFQYPGLQTEFHTDTAAFLKQLRPSQFREETILIKGARVFAFEEIAQALEQKVHQTILEINLNAIVHNLKEYQQLLKPSTKVMAMVKAFAYGSGGAEIAGILQYHKVDYLGVAYADEGVELRKAGITLPVMVMNPDLNTFEAITEYNLEPEMYSFELLTAFDNYLQREGIQHYPVHIEFETGMNRLGFQVTDTAELIRYLNTTTSFKIQSAFSHLAASEEPGQDNYTEQQFSLYNQAAGELERGIGYNFIRHIANSAAAIRHPQMQLDMVRLGIGLYGVDSAATGRLDLHTVATLRSTIAQLKELKKGDSVSYNRKGVVQKDSRIATVRIGYADGYPRRLGNGIGSVYINGKLAPVIGTVCMDMFMIDVTGLSVQEGDEVVLFGKPLSVQQVAEWAGTIPYEIMTGISQRVKRVYYEE